MTKDEILSEIRRTAREHGNVPLGLGQFFQATGIERADWLGKYWARWGDAVREAGLSPNTLQVPYEEVDLLERYISLAREIGRLPVRGELQIKSKSDSGFPAWCTFHRRFGDKSALVRRLVEYCGERADYVDILNLCQSHLKSNTQSQPEDAEESSIERNVGFVYLVKHGNRREYKIGKTFNPVRREGEIILQLPEKVHPVHYIRTDDPSGVEAYWHNRFSAKRKEGEWFELTASDVKAFKRWKRIY